MRSRRHAQISVIAVAGGRGNLAQQIRLELGKSGAFSILALRRHDARNLHEYVGAKVQAIDYSDEEGMARKLTNLKVDVVISVLGGCEGLERQKVLARASKAAGVKLFIPSDFLFESIVEPDLESALTLKADMRNYVRDLELPHLFIFSGLLPEIMFHKKSAFGFDFEKHEARIVGDGSQPASWSTGIDVARFISYILLEHNVEDLVGRSLHIEGDRKSLNEVVEVARAITKTPWTKINEDPESLRSALRSAPHARDRFLDLIKLGIADGVGHHGDDLGNHVYKEWYPTTLREHLRNAVKHHNA